MNNNEEQTIPGVVVKRMDRFTDSRGWLSECFRQDEIDPALYPAMSYISMTYPGIARGPHEHIEQTDYFCFIGPSSFKVYLWDNRKDSPAYGRKEVILVTEDHPISLIVPPGVVHAYKNVGNKEGLIINFANKLYAGMGKKEKVDEVRHENQPNSNFRIED